MIAFGLAYTAKEMAADLRGDGVSSFGDLETEVDTEGSELPPAEPDSESDLPDV